MAFFIRSVVCVVINESAHDMVFSSEVIDHGSYDTPLPAQIPAGGGQATWKSSTCGFMTGTEGKMVFDVPNTGGTFEIYWDNPFIGENTFTQTCTSVPGYKSSAPEGQNPETKENLTNDRLLCDDDVLVTFFVRTKDGSGGEDPSHIPDGRDAPPGNGDPKPVSASAGESALVRDAQIEFRKLLYVGCNGERRQAQTESAKVRRAAQKLPAQKGRMEMVSSITEEDFEGLGREVKAQGPNPSIGRWVKDTLGLTGSQGDKATQYIEQRTAGAHYLLVKAFAQVETELEQMKQDQQKGTTIVSSPMKRLILSGHHNWQGTAGLIYGGMRVHLNDLAELAKIFPTAAAQVEDVCLSACNTGHHANTRLGKDKPEFIIVPGLVKTFPNIQTVWAYTAKAPSGGWAANEIAAWEEASRKPNARKAIAEASRLWRNKSGVYNKDTANHKKGDRWHGYSSIVWTRAGAELVAKLTTDGNTNCFP